MRKSDSAKRLKELMNTLNIKQSDISERAGIPKSAMSMYVSGQRFPRQDRLSRIADVFNINEAWLMGYDVPMERITSDMSPENAEMDAEMTMDTDFKQLYLYWRQMNSIGKQKLLDNASDIARLYSD